MVDDRHARVRAAAWVVVAVAGLAAPAHAQAPTDGFGIERFHLGMDRAAILDVDSAAVPDHGSWSAGVWTGFAHDPLVVYDQQMNAVEALVQRRLTTALVGSIALWNRLELAVDADLIGYQSGAANSPTMKSLPSAGLGDLALVTKVLIARSDAFALAFEPTFAVPLGGATGYLREAGPTFAPAIAVSAASGSVRGAINAGYLFRKRVETAGLIVDNEAFARVGIGVNVAQVAELTWSASAATPVHDVSKNRVAVETLLGASRSISDELGVFVAGGVGLDNGFGTPDWRAVVGVRYADVRGAPVRVVVPVPPPVERPPPPPVDVPTPLAGHVVDHDGRAIARASVTIEAAGKPAIEVVTGDDGAFQATVAPGAIAVSATAPDYQPGKAEVRVVSGTPGTVEVVLTRAVRQGQLRGQVLAYDGKPLAAKITVTGKTTATATADAEGRYTVDLDAGSYEVVIEAEGFATQKRTVSVKLDGVTVLNVDLRGSR
jgi:hypothetical protein